MGRYTQDVATTNQALRIELTYLLRHGYIIKNRSISKSLHWTNNNSISIKSFYSNSEKYLELNYTTTYFKTQEKRTFNYKIELETIPSNIGKGEILYFSCPVSDKRCRILYKCYGSDIWKSREAYSNRIYYDSQLMPKSIRPFKGMFLEGKIEELYNKSKKSHYRGKPTKLRQKIDRLYRQANSVNHEAFNRALYK
jgi:hypothetical protein